MMPGMLSSLLLFCRLAAATLDVQFFPTVTWHAPPRAPGSVFVYRAGPPDRPAREVGWFHAELTARYALGIEKILEAAAQHGCDAVGQIESRFAVEPGVLGGPLPRADGMVHYTEIDASCYVFTPAK